MGYDPYLIVNILDYFHYLLTDPRICLLPHLHLKYKYVTYIYQLYVPYISRIILTYMSHIIFFRKGYCSFAYVF